MLSGLRCQLRKTIAETRSLSTALLWILPLVVAVPAVSQNSSLADVHVAPRGMATNRLPASVGSTLETHTKPLTKDVDLVMIPVTITDEHDKPVLGFTKAQFQVYEQGIPQDIKHLSRLEAPISVAVVIDLSGSMADKLDASREALAEFVKTANRQDEFTIISFADRPELLSDFTSDAETLEGCMAYVIPQGRTALIDAMYLAMAKMKEAHHQRRAVLVISDGADNNSRYTIKEISTALKEADVQVYAIGIYDYWLGTEEEYSGPALLHRLADLSGGHAFTISSSAQLKPAATLISDLLRSQYVLGYTPTNVPKDGKWHDIKVKLLLPKKFSGLHVSAKRGFYSPRPSGHQ